MSGQYPNSIKEYARMVFVECGTVVSVSDAIGITKSNAFNILIELGVFEHKKRIDKILSMFYAGVPVKVISQHCGIKIDSVKRAIHRFRNLDDISEIKIIPHEPFPVIDGFNLTEKHRERLEHLREMKVNAYLKINGKQS